MRGKGGIDNIVMFKQPPCTGKVRDISCPFAGKDGIIIKSAHLRKLDLAIPIGPFDQPHEHFTAMAAGAFGDPIA